MKDLNQEKVNLDECEEARTAIKLLLIESVEIMDKQENLVTSLRDAIMTQDKLIDNNAIIVHEYGLALESNQNTVRKLKRKNKLMGGALAILGAGLITSLVLK